MKKKERPVLKELRRSLQKLHNARCYVERGEVIPSGQGRWIVGANKRQVTIIDAPRCDCPAASFQPGICKHIVAVYLELGYSFKVVTEFNKKMTDYKISVRMSK